MEKDHVKFACVCARIFAAPGSPHEAGKYLGGGYFLENPWSEVDLSLWLEDMGTLSAIARRARLHLRHGGLLHRSPAEVQEASAALRQTTLDCQALFQRSERDLPHA